MITLLVTGVNQVQRDTLCKNWTSEVTGADSVNVIVGEACLDALLAYLEGEHLHYEEIRF